MIAVCEECHETDKIVIKCSQKKFGDHPQGVSSKDRVCEVCGRLRKVVRCYRYGQYVMTER